VSRTDGAIIRRKFEWWFKHCAESKVNAPTTADRRNRSLTTKNRGHAAILAAR
jgi:hypothetical protein